MSKQGQKKLVGAEREVRHLEGVLHQGLHVEAELLPASRRADAMLADVARHGGDGGIIAVTKTGEVVFAWNSPGMKRAAAGSHLSLMSAVR